MAVYPNREALDFCYWMLNVSWQKLTTPRLNIITDVYNAAVASTFVSDNTWNNFTQVTAWRYKYYQVYRNLALNSNYFVEEYLAQWSIYPPDYYVTALNILVDDLVNSGNWYYLYDMRIFATPTSDGSLVNLKVPTSSALVPVNAPTFTANEGYNGNGTTQYLSTPFIPDTTPSFPFQNDAQYGVYVRTNVDENKYLYGVRDGSVFTSYRARVAGFGYANLNQGATSNFINTDSRGLHSMIRPASNALSIWRNGVNIGNSTNASNGTANLPVYILCSNELGTPSLFATTQVSMWYAARAGLNPVSFYQAFQNFATAIGFNV